MLTNRNDAAPSGRCRCQGGFTLLEVVTVVVILAILALVALPMAGNATTFDRRGYAARQSGRLA